MNLVYERTKSHIKFQKADINVLFGTKNCCDRCVLRINKVSSDAIKLYETSQVKFKTVGNTREVQFTVGNKECKEPNQRITV